MGVSRARSLLSPSCRASGSTVTAPSARSYFSSPHRPSPLAPASTSSASPLATQASRPQFPSCVASPVPSRRAQSSRPGSSRPGERPKLASIDPRPDREPEPEPAPKQRSDTRQQPGPKKNKSKARTPKKEAAAESHEEDSVLFSYKPAQQRPDRASRPTKQQTEPLSPPKPPPSHVTPFSVALNSETARQAISDLSKTPLHLQDNHVPHADESATGLPPTGFHYLPSEIWDKDKSFEALDKLLLTARAHPDTRFSEEAMDRSEDIWDVYKAVHAHNLIPGPAWSAILENVVPPINVARSHTGKRTEFGSSIQRGSSELTNYLRRGYESRFFRVMQDKATAGFEPLQQEFMQILEHFAPNGYVKGVESVFAAMVLKGHTPGPEAYELRLSAIVHWLRRYESLEAEALIAEGLLHPYDVAIASVPPLLSTIMDAVNAAGFKPALSRRTVDLACELLADTGDSKAYNLLVRYEYGIDMDVPDAIPEEFIARLQRGENVQRGLSEHGLMSALKLWKKEGDFYKMLSKFETFAYAVAMPAGTPKGLDRKASHQWKANPAAFERDGLAFAPPLPPTTAIKMMSLTKVAGTEAPRPKLVGSEETDPSSASDQDSASVSSPSTTSASTYRPSTLDLCYPRPNLNNVTAHMFTLLLEGPCSSSGPNKQGDLFLARHILTHGLAHHYEQRAQQIGQYLYVLSLDQSQDRGTRTRFREHMDRRHPWLARMKWFILFSECCARNPGREAFEALRWAEKEMNGLRASLQMDREVVAKVDEMFTADDLESERERRADALENLTRPPPNTQSSPSHFLGPSLPSLLSPIHSQLKTYHSPALSLLSYRLASLAWRETTTLTALLAPPNKRPHAYTFPSGSHPRTLGGRLEEYASLLRERLPQELEPGAAEGGVRGAEEFEALFREQEKVFEERMGRPVEEGGGLGGERMAWNWGVTMGGRWEVTEGGEDLERERPSPFRRHQMKKASRYGKYPTPAEGVRVGWEVPAGGEREGEGQGGEKFGDLEGEETGKGRVPEEVKDIRDGWEREKGEVERRYQGELEEVAPGIWA